MAPLFPPGVETLVVVLVRARLQFETFMVTDVVVWFPLLSSARKVTMEEPAEVGVQEKEARTGLPEGAAGDKVAPGGIPKARIVTVLPAG
jgi:hypothetical protein